MRGPTALKSPSPRSPLVAQTRTLCSSSSRALIKAGRALSSPTQLRANATALRTSSSSSSRAAIKGARVGLKPVIEHVIEVLKAGGIEEILVIVGRKKESIMDHLGSGELLGVNLYYRVQEEPKGTAHAVLQGKGFIGDDDFVVMYGDNYFKPYGAMRDIQAFHESCEADATIVLSPVDDPTRFGIARAHMLTLFCVCVCMCVIWWEGVFFIIIVLGV